MLKLRSLVVLAVTTWAFVVCFAVWLMFGVTGIPISRELNLKGSNLVCLPPPQCSRALCFAYHSASGRTDSVAGS
jgi:hypothetical protein